MNDAQIRKSLLAATDAYKQNHRNTARWDNAMQTLLGLVSQQKSKSSIWTSAMIEQLTSLHREGKSYKQIAAIMGMRPSQITFAVCEYKVAIPGKMNTPHVNPWTPEQDELLKQKWENEEITAAALGKLLGRTAFAVNQRTRVLGLKKFSRLANSMVYARMVEGHMRSFILDPDTGKERGYLPYLWEKTHGTKIGHGKFVVPRDGNWTNPNPEMLLCLPTKGEKTRRFLEWIKQGKDPLVQQGIAQDKAKEESQTAQREAALEKQHKAEKLAKEYSKQQQPQGNDLGRPVLPRLKMRIETPKPVTGKRQAPDITKLAHVSIGKLVRHVQVGRLESVLNEHPSAVVEYLPLTGQPSKDTIRDYEKLYPLARIVVL